MAKVAGGIVFGLGLLTFAVVARQDQAHATPGSGCKQWAVQAYRAMSDETLPEGWEPFGITTRDRVALRRCVKD